MGGGGDDTLIFSYICSLGPFFGFNILNFNIFFWWGGGGGLSEKLIFFGA